MKKFEEFLSSEIEKTNTRIVRVLQSEEPLMQEIMNWVLQGKGKQLRPRFLIASAQLSGKYVDATEYAAMLEIIHMASLIHDDIVDKADTRRGQESVNKKYGTKMAVYAGDYMMFSVFSKTEIRPSIGHRKMYHTLSRVCDGELGQNSCLYDLDITEERYIQNIRGKSAAMFALACELGARTAKQRDKEVESIKLYGENFGVLFQIYDDLLDLGLPVADIGKPIFQDIVNGIYSLPIIYALGCHATHAQTKRILFDAKRSQRVVDTNEIYSVIRRSNALARCDSIVDGRYIVAKNALEHFKDNGSKKYFIGCLDVLYSKIKDAITHGGSKR